MQIHNCNNIDVWVPGRGHRRRMGRVRGGAGVCERDRVSEGEGKMRPEGVGREQRLHSYSPVDVQEVHII